MKSRCRNSVPSLVPGYEPPPVAPRDCAVELTEQARAFRQIRKWTERDEFALEESLLEVLPAFLSTGESTDESAIAFVARSLTFLALGQVAVHWRQMNCQVTRLTPVFYQRELDCFFSKFDCESADGQAIELWIHTTTILDARELLNEWCPEPIGGEQIDLVEFLLQSRVAEPQQAVG